MHAQSPSRAVPHSVPAPAPPPTGKLYQLPGEAPGSNVQPSGADQAGVMLGNTDAEIAEIFHWAGSFWPWMGPLISDLPTQAEVQALCDKCEELAARYARDYRLRDTLFHTSLEGMLDQVKPQAVATSTKPSS